MMSMHDALILGIAIVNQLRLNPSREKPKLPVSKKVAVASKKKLVKVPFGVRKVKWMFSSLPSSSSSSKGGSTAFSHFQEAARKAQAPADRKRKAPLPSSSITSAKKPKQVTASKMVSQKIGASAKGGNFRRQKKLVANGKIVHYGASPKIKFRKLQVIIIIIKGKGKPKNKKK